MRYVVVLFLLLFFFNIFFRTDGDNDYVDVVDHDLGDNNDHETDCDDVGCGGVEVMMVEMMLMVMGVVVVCCHLSY